MVDDEFVIVLSEDVSKWLNNTSGSWKGISLSRYFSYPEGPVDTTTITPMLFRG